MIYMEYAKDSQEKPLANGLSRDNNAEDKNLWSSYKMWRYKTKEWKYKWENYRIREHRMKDQNINDNIKRLKK